MNKGLTHRRFSRISKSECIRKTKLANFPLTICLPLHPNRKWVLLSQKYRNKLGNKPINTNKYFCVSRPHEETLCLILCNPLRVNYYKCLYLLLSTHIQKIANPSGSLMFESPSPTYPGAPHIARHRSPQKAFACTEVLVGEKKYIWSWVVTMWCVDRLVLLEWISQRFIFLVNLRFWCLWVKKEGEEPCGRHAQSFKVRLQTKNPQVRSYKMLRSNLAMGSWKCCFLRSRISDSRILVLRSRISDSGILDSQISDSRISERVHCQVRAGEKCYRPLEGLWMLRPNFYSTESLWKSSTTLRPT